MRRAFTRGFTIIEVMMVITVIGVLIMVGVPSFIVWTQNTQIRAAAEGILAGMQVAKNEAIRRNVRVQIKLVNGSGWCINLSTDPDAQCIQSRAHEEGSINAIVATSPPDSNTLTFNSLGRIAQNADGSPSMNQITIDNLILQPVDRRTLMLMIPPAGGVRMCDPRLAPGDPRAC